MEGVAKDGGISTVPSFSDEEKEILELYDQVQKLELEVALAKARVSLTGKVSPGRPCRRATADKLAEEGERQGDDDNNDDIPDDPAEIEEARSQLLEAMSLYSLRNGVVQNVLITNPLLKGIHGSTSASPIEQDILPWVRARDSASQDVATQSATARRVLGQLTEAESETLRAARRNRELAAEILRLTREEADRGRAGAAGADPAAEGQIAELEKKLAASMQRWRVMKGTASGIVAGSGADWAADPALREVVLDPE